MPYKEAVIELIDVMDASAAAIDSVNTIVNDSGVLTAYNTDYLAVAKLLAEQEVDPGSTVLLRGSGGMAKAVAAALYDAGFAHVTLVARNEVAGRKLAELYSYAWIPEINDESAQLLINVTPLGMQGSEEATQSFSDACVEAAEVIFDVVALPEETPLIKAARRFEKKIITGAQVIALQAEEQFFLYTGVRPAPELVKEASVFSRSTV